MDVERRWRACCEVSAGNATACDAVWQELAQAYAEPIRNYHGMAHIAALLDLSAHYRSDLRDPVAVDLAIFFHDVVYDPMRSDNEVASAARAADRLVALEVQRSVIGRVTDLIDMTRHGAVEPASDDTDAQYFLDFDLSVLGADARVYAAYAAAIRREYQHVPDADFRAGRVRVLRGFLGQPAIYRVAALRAKWEAHARKNLACEIATLDSAA